MVLSLILLVFSQVISDFQVNQEDYVSKTIQAAPAIAHYDSGGVVTWSDMRMWPNIGRMMVFGARLDTSGDTIGTNFRINDDTTQACSYGVDIDSDYHGNFSAVWRQYGNVTCRRFYNDGTPVGSSFIVNDQPGDCGNPSIAIDSSGWTVIVWSDNREGLSRVYCQIYDGAGNPVGTNAPVSDSLQSITMECGVSISGNKDCVIVWGFSNDIWCQRLDSLGNKIGENFKIWNDSLNIDEDHPQIKCSRDGNFLVTWSTDSAGDVFYRLFDSSAVPLTEVIKINEPTLIYSWVPKVTIIQDSLWCVAWHDTAVFLQRISNSGIVIGDNIQINEPIGRRNLHPDIDVTAENIFVTWARQIAYVWHIMIQQVTPDGNLSGQNRIVTDDKGGSPQHRPDIVVDATGNFFIVWDDARNPEHMDSDQFGRLFDAQGTPFGNDFRINNYINAVNSSITISSLGLYVTVWARDYPDSNSQIYGQRFDHNGVPLGPNFPISLSPENSGTNFPIISALSDNRFIALWQDFRSLPAYVYGRILDPLGIPQGDEFTVYIDSTAYNTPWTIVDEENGKFILGMACSNESIGVAIQEFDYDAHPISVPIVLNDEPASDKIVVGTKGIDRYLFVWAGFDDMNIHGQLLDENLQKIGTNFLVNDDTFNYKGHPSVVSNYDGKFFVAWHDGRNGDLDIFGQFFDSLGNKAGDNFKVVNDTTNGQQWTPTCFAKNNLIYIVWSDDRIPSHWFDIYCKVIEWPEMGICANKITIPHHRMTIKPNPFRKILNIIFNNPDALSTLCKLQIYDVSGRLIKHFVLPNADSSASNSITWDGTDDKGTELPSGVYFLKFQAGEYKETKKLILLR